jgi:uncharacterized protein (DUF2267 family)
MAMKGLEVFDKTTQLTELWVNDVAKELSTDDKHKAFQGLRATLHVLRDRLNLGEAANLGAELPILLAGFYFEGWKPENNPTKERTKEEFLDRLRNHLHNYALTDVDAEQLARSVFKVLTARVPAGEVENVTHNLHTGLKELFPESVRA